MAIRDLVPSFRREGRGMVRREDPFMTLRREMNRLFDEFWTGGSVGLPALPALGGVFSPQVDVSETPEAVEVTAELPGMTEKDVDLTLSTTGDVLTLRGEKKTEREERRGSGFWTERSYGSFYRDIPLPTEVDEGKIAAHMKNGVLHVKLGKREGGEGTRKHIPIKTTV
jgi:HSP20 family protein